MRIALFPCQKKRKQPQISSAIHGRKAHGAAVAPARTPQAQAASRLRHLPTLRRAMENSAWFVHREIRERRTRQRAGTFHSSIVKRLCRGVCFAPQISLPQRTVEKARGADIAPARTPPAQASSRLRHLPTLRRAMENNAWFVHHKIRKRRVRPARRHTSRLYREKTLPWCPLCAQISLPQYTEEKPAALPSLPPERLRRRQRAACVIFPL